MAGTIHRKLEIYNASGNDADTARNNFVALYKFFKNQCNCTEIASYYGGDTAGGFGTGFDFTGETNPPKHNAYAVFKFATNSGRNFSIYYLIQWTEDAHYFGYNYSGNKGQPGLADAAANYNIVAISAAIGIDSGGNDANPWRGGTGAAGADTKADPVWGVSGGSVLVFPRSNNTGGSHTTKKENMHLIYVDSANSGTRMQLYADDDGVLIQCDLGLLGTYGTIYLGMYTVVQGLSTARPFVDIGDPGNNKVGWTVGTIWGPTTGGFPNGGVVTRAGTVVGITRDILSGHCPIAAHHPNGQFAVPEYGEYRIFLYANEAPAYGALGEIDTAIVRECYNSPQYRMNAASTRCVIGSSTVQLNTKFVVSWDGVTNPGTGATKEGVIS
jgi:hypothetical protein